ncbi:MAG: DedA family protein [Pirellulales bacterium]|nr:DedA family protein [Pirellulales bacterium]
MLDTLQQYPYLWIIGFLVLTGCGLPIPEEVPIVYAGFKSAVPGELTWYYALLACFVGALLGDSVMYWIGYHFGRGVLRDHPWYTGFLTPEREKQIETTIEKHGLKAFFLARFMVGVRGPMYITAGILRVPYRRFLIADAISASVVITLFFSLAYFFGSRVSEWITRGTQYITGFVLVLIVVGIIAWYIKNRLKASLFQQEQQTLSGQEETGDSIDENEDPERTVA